MPDDDLLAEAQIDACLRSMAANLHRALEELEAVLASSDTPLTKVDRAAGILEELGDRLERVTDWVPG